MLRRRFLAGATASLGLAATPSAFPQIGSTDIMNATLSVPHHAISADGTTIAYWSIGSGPPLIFVVGAFNDHTTGSELAAVLSSRFTVITYDRRGRGASGDAATYAVEREIEDLAAIVAAAGGEASALGFSSGAALVLMAAAQGVPLTRLVPFEVPWIVGDTRPRPRPDMVDHLRALVDTGRRGEAVEAFQRDCVGIPEDVIVQLRNAPFRPALEAMAHTLVYEATIMGDFTVPDGLLPRIGQPALVLCGGRSPAWMAATAAFVAAALPSGRVEIVPDIGHDLTPPLAPPITAFLGR